MSTFFKYHKYTDFVVLQAKSKINIAGKNNGKNKNRGFYNLINGFELSFLKF